VIIPYSNYRPNETMIFIIPAKAPRRQERQENKYIIRKGPQIKR